MQIDIFLDAIWERWYMVVLMVCLVVLCIYIQTFKILVHIGVTTCAALICFLLIREISTFCHVVELRDESDTEAASAYFVLKKRLSNDDIFRLIKQEKDANSRFYLALMAAERHLPLAEDIILATPGFFTETGLNRISRRISFPTSGAKFVEKIESSRLKMTNEASWK